MISKKTKVVYDIGNWVEKYIIKEILK